MEMYSELVGKIVTGVLTAIVTLAVCMINNYYQNKRQQNEFREKEQERMEALENLHKKQLEEIKETFSRQIQSIKDQFTAQAEELMANQMEMRHMFEKKIEMLDYQFKEMTLEVHDHNNFAKRMPVMEEQIKVINHRLEDLEKKEKHQ